MPRNNLPPDYDDVVEVEPTPYFVDGPPAHEPVSPLESAGPSVPSTPLPISDAFPPAPPPVYTGPLQFVFMTEDVLNSKVIQAHSGIVAFTTSSANPAQTKIVDGGGGPVLDILWQYDDAPELNVDFKGQTVKLKQWMTRSKASGVLFNIRHKGSLYDVFQAGSDALGLRLSQTTTMLCGIRDPYRNVEIVVSPEGMEALILPIAITFCVLIKSKRPLGKDLDGKKVSDKVWRGVDYVFRSAGRSTVLDMGPSAGVGKDYRKSLLRK